MEFFLAILNLQSKQIKQQMQTNTKLGVFAPTDTDNIFKLKIYWPTAVNTSILIIIYSQTFIKPERNPTTRKNLLINNSLTQL